MICKRDREKWERGWNGKIDHKKFDHQFRMKNNSTKSDKNSSWRPPPPEKRKFDMISKD